MVAIVLLGVYSGWSYVYSVPTFLDLYVENIRKIYM